MKWTLLDLEILLKYLKKMWRLGGPEVYLGESKVEEQMEISDDPQTLSPSRIQGFKVLICHSTLCAQDPSYIQHKY